MHGVLYTQWNAWIYIVKLKYMLNSHTHIRASTRANRRVCMERERGREREMTVSIPYKQAV